MKYLTLIILIVVIIQDTSTQILKRQKYAALDHKNNETPETRTLRNILKSIHPDHKSNPASPVHKFNNEISRVQKSNAQNNKQEKNMNWKAVYGKGYSDSVKHIQKELDSKEITDSNVKEFEAHSGEIDAIYKGRKDQMNRAAARYNKLINKQKSGKTLAPHEQKEVQDYAKNKAGHLHALGVWDAFNRAIKRKIAQHKQGKNNQQRTGATEPPTTPVP